MTLGELIASGARQLEQAGVAFGHGTTNAHDEAAWLVLWRLGLPLDSDLDSMKNQPVAPASQAQVATLFEERIATRKPAAYLTREAWLQGVPFYVDERAIVPRSFIAELIAGGGIDEFLSDQTRRVLDLCTGNGSLAVLAAMAWPEVEVTGADLSLDALAVARTNVDRHGLQERITLAQSDGLAALPGPWDLILCNPPYVNAASMAALPPNTAPSPSWPWRGATTAWTSSASCWPTRPRAWAKMRCSCSKSAMSAPTSRPPSPSCLFSGWKPARAKTRFCWSPGRRWRPTTSTRHNSGLGRPAGPC